MSRLLAHVHAWDARCPAGCHCDGEGVVEHDATDLAKLVHADDDGPEHVARALGMSRGDTALLVAAYNALESHDCRGTCGNRCRDRAKLVVARHEDIAEEHDDWHVDSEGQAQCPACREREVALMRAEYERERTTEGTRSS